MSIFSSGALSGASGGSDVWLLWGFADLAQPVCRAKDESRPAGAIVHAYSIVASRNGAAGYKLMRSSHPTWASTLDRMRRLDDEALSAEPSGDDAFIETLEERAAATERFRRLKELLTSTELGTA